MIKWNKLWILIPCLFFGYGCAIKQTIIENPPRIEGRYDYVSMNLSIFKELPSLSGLPTVKDDRYNRFKAKYIDPIIKREFFNYDSQIILKGTRLDLNIPQVKLIGDLKLTNNKREPSIMMIWRYYP